MKEAIGKFLHAVTLVKPLVEVVAIVIAGWWAYSSFIKIDEPALKENFGFESKLAWHPLKGNSACVAEDQFKVTNLSKSTVGVQRVLRRAWLIDGPQPSSGITHFDPMEKALSTEPIDEQSYGDGEPFVQTYPPGASSEYAFEWVVENKPDKYAVFRLDLYADENAKELLDFRYDWGPPCEIESQSTSAPASPSGPTKRCSRQAARHGSVGLKQVGWRGLRLNV